MSAAKKGVNDHLATLEMVRERFIYCPDTGLLVYRKTGKEAGHLDKCLGYRVVSIRNTAFRVHRIVWLYHTGAWPSGEIDHINRVRSDNRMVNLRDVSHRDNMCNRVYTNPRQRKETAPDGSPLPLGVSIRAGRFRATINIRKRWSYLGTFDTVGEAVAARQIALSQHNQLSPA